MTLNLPLRAKLFLALFLTGLLVVAGTHAFVNWSLQRGLEEWASERRQQRIERIGERLVDIYRQQGSWQPLSADQRLWISALLERGGPLPRAANHPPLHPLRSPPWLGHAVDEPGVWPPERALEHIHGMERPAPLELRLMLLDAAGDIVYGRPDLLEQARDRYPLALDGEPIGSLALLPGPSITEIAELRFRERQRGQLWIIAAGMALLAAVVAIPLSALLTRPVATFQRTMRRLAAGDYSARARITGRDELARLGHDLNALAAALQQTEQARRRWVADISHELRTPLALLRGDVEAMQDGVRPLDAQALARLHGDSERLGRLVDDLYELSMTDLGALSYRKQPVDVAALLAEELDAFSGPFADAGVALELEPPEPAPAVLEADAQRLSQLFRNLLRNSLRYTDRGGRLRVAIGHDGEGLRLTFDDTAPGVPEDALPRLFERLYRVDASRSRATGGAGLGLAIARNIVLAHDGTIDAAPSPLGGLRIRIRLGLGAR